MKATTVNQGHSTAPADKPPALDKDVPVPNAVVTKSTTSVAQPSETKRQLEASMKVFDQAEAELKDMVNRLFVFCWSSFHVRLSYFFYRA